MVVSNEFKEVVSLFANGMIWIYVGIFFVLTYLFISLLTWSFIKPLKYVGIPTLIVGLLFISIRASSNVLVNIFVEGDNLINTLMPSLLKPILINGLICFLVGLGMIVGYIFINKKTKNKEVEENVQEAS